MRRLGLLLAILSLAVASTSGAARTEADCCTWDLVRANANGTGHHLVLANFGVLGWDIEDMSPDRTRLLFSHIEGQLEIASLAGDDEEVLADGVQGAARFSPDGRWVAFARYSASCGVMNVSIWVVRADGKGLRRVTATCAQTAGAWSPDSRSIAFVHPATSTAHSGRITVVNRDGTGERALTRAVLVGGRLRWSPRGDRIAYVADPEPERLHVVRVKGRRDLSIARGRDPRWSPGGHWLAFASGSWQAQRDAVIRPDGSHFRRLGDGQASSAAWSPDGRVGFRSGEALWVQRPAAGPARRIARFAIAGPWWAPNGSVAYEHYVSESTAISVARSDGSHARRVTIERPPTASNLNGVSIGQVWWALDSRSLIYERTFGCCS